MACAPTTCRLDDWDSKRAPPCSWGRPWLLAGMAATMKSSWGWGKCQGSRGLADAGFGPRSFGQGSSTLCFAAVLWQEEFRLVRFKQFCLILVSALDHRTCVNSGVFVDSHDSLAH